MHLAIAVWALRRMHREHHPEIDMNYVRIRDYHGRQIREGKAISTPVGAFVAALPEVRGALFSRSDCVVQKAAKVTAIVSTGSLTLGEGVTVKEFADCRDEMIVGDSCSIGSSATSSVAIRLGRNVIAGSVFAPEITTSGVSLPPQVSAARVEPVHIPPSGGQAAKSDRRTGPLRRIADDTWLFDGDLEMGSPLSVAGNLIVLGSLSAAAGSVLRGDVKTRGDLILGENCFCRGSLVSDRDLELGRGTRFARSVYAAGELKIGAGTIGEGPDAIGVYGRSGVLLEGGISIRGRIASEGWVSTS
jgi:hypothetical protein